jgi:hypothetical protein
MKLKKVMRKFHRYIGLIAGLWLFVLASTGFLLQHSHDWHLDKSYIKSPLLLKTYGIGKQFIAFQQDKHQLLQLDKQIIQDHTSTIKLEESINSAIHQNDYWVLATPAKIIWLNDSGQIIQTLDELDGLAIPIKTLGINNEIIYAQAGKSIVEVRTLKQLDKNTQNIKWSQAQNPEAQLTQELKQQTIQENSQNYLSYQQLIFDIHAAITVPSLLNDIAALSLLYLSISGIILFFRKNKKTINT